MKMNKTMLLGEVANRSGIPADECGVVLKTFERVLCEELTRKLYRYGGWILLLIGLFISAFAFGQISDRKGRPVQTLRGMVVDGDSKYPIPYATVRLSDKEGMGTTTDSLGRFTIPQVPVGRHTVEAAFMGYEPGIFREILVTSAKEVYLEIPLKESVNELSEVVVRARTNKEEAMNKMATTGARMLTVDEGVRIPNPNHFADIATLGGGILSSLSSQVLGNSDFFTGAFPAEYGNAVSGVFDMKLRNGNNQKNENTIQVGIMGIDVASEGPLSKKHKASYIFNYRYSTTGLLNLDGGTMDYQDLNFKLNFPTKMAGTFSVWGTSLIDKFKSDMERNPEKWEYLGDRNGSRDKQYMAAGGISHRYFFNSDASLKTTVAATYSQLDGGASMFNHALESTPYMDLESRHTNLILTSTIVPLSD